jgi:16S rRNA (uracil1498-N3)-methyltransferase
MPRFYCSEPLHAGAALALPEACSHHIHVLRLQPGDAVQLFDGRGDEGQWSADIVAVEKKRVTVQVREFEPLARELPYAITIAQALPEAAKMDWIVEKAIELGAQGIAPLAAQRCVVRLSGERAEKRHAHWARIVEAATEQCGRARLAHLAPLQDFHKALAPDGRKVLLTPRATATLADWARAQKPHDLTLLIGPEGGYTPQEEDAAIAAGAVPLGLGARVLRTETAALAALATLAALWGER